MAREAPPRGGTLRHWALGAALCTLLALCANCLLGPLNQDEGWYLYAARKVMAGALPHRDFFFSQGLGFPLFYALFGWLWSAGGLLGGRLFTALLSFAALLLADGAVVSACRRADDRWVARLALWSFLGLNLWYTYFTAIPKAYALCTLLIAGALRLLTGLRADRTCDPLCAAGAGLLLALCTEVRLSMGILLPAVALWLLCRRVRVGRLGWLWFSLGAGVPLLLFLGLHLLLWPEAWLAAQTFHAQRLSMGLLGRIGCVARWLRFNPLLAFFGLLVAWLRLTRRPALKMPAPENACRCELWLCCAAALAGVHLLAPVPYDDYQVPATLPLAMAVAFTCTQLPFDSLKAAFARLLPLAALALTLAASPLAQDWMILGQDRFWVRVKRVPDLVQLRRVGAQLRALAAQRGEHTLWTQDLYLAVEAGLDVPEGLEMGPFSPPCPALDLFTVASGVESAGPGGAERQALVDSLLGPAPKATRPCSEGDQALLFSPPAPPLPKRLPRLAAWTGYTFALAYPHLSPAPEREMCVERLKKVYNIPVLTLPDFGQGYTTLVVAERPAP